MSEIEVTKTDSRIFPPNAEFVAKAHISSLEQYHASMRRSSTMIMKGFWAKLAQ